MIPRPPPSLQAGRRGAQQQLQRLKYPSTSSAPLRARPPLPPLSSSPSSTTTTTAAAGKDHPSSTPANPAENQNPYGWQTDAQAQAQAAARHASDPRVRPVRVTDIRRPLGRTRANDQAKVAALVESITEAGLLEPIDVLEVDGVIYGFSGCHRYEAHVKLGRETILCRVRKATRKTLEMHLR